MGCGCQLEKFGTPGSVHRSCDCIWEKGVWDEMVKRGKQIKELRIKIMELKSTVYDFEHGDRY